MSGKEDQVIAKISDETLFRKIGFVSDKKAKI